MMTDSTQTNLKDSLKETLNLPKTSFPMRANLAQNEPQTLKHWDSIDLYSRIVESNSGAEPFVFHDGPPYANGSIHVGHLLNKVLKDFVFRSQNMMGRYCPFIPGWDCHGLPIEHKVMTELISKKKEKFDALSDDVKRIAIRNECAKYAEKYIKIQGSEMKQLLTQADYANPYLTMTRDYEERVLDVFAGLLKEGIVYRQLKPVHWSMSNQTALAEAELEYEDKVDPSIFVTMNATDSDKVNALFKVDSAETISFMIWTTTPWTLPANLAIAVHPRHEYALVSHDNSHFIVAKDLIESIQTATEKDGFSVLGTVKGEALVGLEYAHPFCNRTGKIAAADYVTLEDGTGLVHTAPGHGVDDYHTGLKEKLDIYCPVTANGTFDDTVPDWIVGQHIWKANPKIIEHLVASGHMFYHTEFSHSYPHDWRSKTPVIFRSTEQWFISVDNPTKSSGKSLRELALEAIDKDINFVPAWGQSRLRGMLESRPDWCLSRQRSWGLPIPAFRQANNELFMTEASVKAIAKLFGEQGSDAWFKQSPTELLVHYDPKSDPDAPDDLDIGSLEKLFDIFDVWFESGSSWNAVLNARGGGSPADLYLEGSDQHRGWFHLSLLPSLGITQKAPFKSVLTHGFIVDKDGRKMSKSVGNAITVEEILKKYGAEVTRWWVSGLSFENDIKVDISFFDVAGDGYRKIRNTLRFLLSNLDGFPVDTVTDTHRSEFISALNSTSIDAYILGKLGQVQSAVTEAYKGFKFKTANQLIYDFCNDDLSSFYCAAVKDRLYCDKKDAQRRVVTQTTLMILTESLCELLAPILPHTAEESYKALYQSDSGHTVHFKTITPLEVHASADWVTVLEQRDLVLKALEAHKEKGIDNPLDAGIQISGDILSSFSDDLPDIFGVSRVEIVSGKNGEQLLNVTDLRDQPRCDRSWKRDASVKERRDGVYLSDRDAEAMEL